MKKRKKPPSNKARKSLGQNGMKTLNTETWFIVHIIFPLFPFILESSIRLIVSRFNFSWDAFSGATLAISCGFLCVFINQSLANKKGPLDDEYITKKRAQWATIFIMLTMIFVLLFTAVMICDSLVTYHNISIALEIRNTFNSIIVICCIPTIYTSLRAQRTFDLEATL